MSGFFEIKKSANGQFFFHLTAGNGEIILASQQYAAKSSAQDGIASVQVNCGQDDRYERLTSTDKREYFTLKAANGQVIGTSQMYANATNRDAGIGAVKSGGKTKEIKDNA